MYKIVADANIIISAWINKAGNPRQLLSKYLTGGKYVLIMSDEIINETKKVASRSKFETSESDIDDFLFPLIIMSDIVKIKSSIKIVDQDPDDDAIINTAYDGDADYIVSGDNHLLKLKKYGKIQIVNVATMLKILQSSSQS